MKSVFEPTQVTPPPFGFWQSAAACCSILWRAATRRVISLYLFSNYWKPHTPLPDILVKSTYSKWLQAHTGQPNKQQSQQKAQCIKSGELVSLFSVLSVQIFVSVAMDHRQMPQCVSVLAGFAFAAVVLGGLQYQQQQPSLHRALACIHMWHHPVLHSCPSNGP